MRVSACRSLSSADSANALARASVSAARSWSPRMMLATWETRSSAEEVRCRVVSAENCTTFCAWSPEAAFSNCSSMCSRSRFIASSPDHRTCYGWSAHRVLGPFTTSG
jgi:hypothetical protein